MPQTGDSEIQAFVKLSKDLILRDLIRHLIGLTIQIN